MLTFILIVSALGFGGWAYFRFKENQEAEQEVADELSKKNKEADRKEYSGRASGYATSATPRTPVSQRTTPTPYVAPVAAKKVEEPKRDSSSTDMLTGALIGAAVSSWSSPSRSDDSSSSSSWGSSSDSSSSSSNDSYSSGGGDSGGGGSSSDF